MSNELNVDKVMRGLNVPRLMDKAVIRKFGRKEDNSQVSVAYIRALEEATRDVVLTVDDCKAAAGESDQAMKERLAKRDNREA